MKDKVITLKQIIVIDKIINKNSAYVKTFEITEGDRIELTFTVSGKYKGEHSHKIGIHNLSNGKCDYKVVPKTAWQAFTKSFEYHETI